MGVYGGPNDFRDMVRDGLVFAADSNHERSYSGSGNIWHDFVGSTSGDLLNGPTFESDGFGFSGGTDGIRFNIGLNTSGYDSINISGWVNITTGGTWYRWFSGANVGVYHKPDLAILSDGALGYYHSGLVTSWVDTNQLINLTEWANISYNFKSSGDVEAFINGALVHSASYTSGVLPSTFNFMLGNRYDLNGEAIVGKIAMTLLYNKALSSLEVLQNFNAQKNRFGL
jgi:hypothetical protein